MEMREKEDFANSVKSVAESLFGQKRSAEYAKGQYWDRPPHVDRYLPMLKAGLQEANRRKGDGGAFDAIVLHQLEGKIEHGVLQSADGIAWTVAHLILSGDEDIAKADPMDVRYLFDAALGVAVNDYNACVEGGSRYLAYQKPSKRGSTSEAIEINRKMAEYYRGIQAKLREPVSVAPAAQRR